MEGLGRIPPKIFILRDTESAFLPSFPVKSITVKSLNASVN